MVVRSTRRFAKFDAELTAERRFFNAVLTSERKDFNALRDQFSKFLPDIRWKESRQSPAGPFTNVPPPKQLPVGPQS